MLWESKKGATGWCGCWWALGGSGPVAKRDNWVDCGVESAEALGEVKGIGGGIVGGER